MTIETISIDYDNAEVPESARRHKPMIFRDGNKYCALLGIDPQEGIFGCGDSPVEALISWDKDYRRNNEQGTRNVE